MVGRSLDAHNECNAPALMEETPKALRVAVVEDDPRIQQLISAEITDEGHACICFGSAEDFLDEAGSDRFDLLLLDLMLPGMDGLACLKQLQHQAASQPALDALTSLFRSASLWARADPVQGCATPGRTGAKQDRCWHASRRKDPDPLDQRPANRPAMVCATRNAGAALC